MTIEPTTPPIPGEDRVIDVASLAPATVADADEAIKKGRSLRRRKPKPRAPRASKVEVVEADPDVWQTALELAAGVVARIERISPTEVIVHNQPRR